MRQPVCGWSSGAAEGEPAKLVDAVLPPRVLTMPPELEAVDALLDDPVFFEPFVAHFDPAFGRPSTPIETFLRLGFLTFRLRLGWEPLCVLVQDSITLRRFCRIPLTDTVPHPTTLMKIMRRCGAGTVEGLHDRLIAKAIDEHDVKVEMLRGDTTVVEADVTYPTDSGLLAKAVRRMVVLVRRIQAAGGPDGPGCVTAPARPRGGHARSQPTSSGARVRPHRRSPGSPASWLIWPSRWPPTRTGR
jgi:transposase, IS5 family